MNDITNVPTACYEVWRESCFDVLKVNFGR